VTGIWYPRSLVSSISYNPSLSDRFHLLIEGRHGERLAKEFGVGDFQSNRVSSYLLKEPRVWKELHLTGTLIRPLGMGVLGMMRMHGTLS
jgi:hypothetical protein